MLNNYLGIIIVITFLFGCKESINDDFDTSSNVILSHVRIEEHDNKIELLSDLNPIYNEKLETTGVYFRSGTKPISKYIINTHNDFDYTTNINADLELVNDQKALEKISGIKKPILYKKARNVAFASNKKFRLIIYDKLNKGIQLFNAELTTGQRPDIKLDVGKSYYWFAYSLGDANPVPDIDENGVIPKAHLANKDFLFHSGILDVKTGQNYLQIIFKRQTSRFEVTLNTRGIFGPMKNSTNLSVGENLDGEFMSLLQYGNFDIFSGTYKDLSTLEAGVSAEEAENVSEFWKDEEKIFRFHTALNTQVSFPINALVVKLNALDITLDDGTTRTFTPNTIIPLNNSIEFSLKKGFSASTNINLIEAPIVVNGVKWARTNLVYDPAKLYNTNYVYKQSNAFRFRPNNNYTVGSKYEYWNFTGISPFSTEMNGSPCQNVYPETSWYGASDENGRRNFALLQEKPSTYEVTEIDGLYRHSFVWQPDLDTNPNSAYPEHVLRLNVLGKRIGNETSYSLIDLPNSSPTTSGAMYYNRGRYYRDDDNYNLYILYKTVPTETDQSNFETITINGLEGSAIRCVSSR